ncbi:MAG: cation:proton antiporter [Rhodospirillales bacterium]|jgi:CPA1 family monovalent cation:H+ antiporter
MITTLLMISGILFLAIQLEEKFKIPSPLGLITLSFVAHYLFQGVPILTGDTEHFAKLVVFLLPILLIADSLELTLQDLRENGLSLLYLAIVAIALSLTAALLISEWIFADYRLSTAAVIVLFTMVLATDPVSVVSIFSKFELPHRLKILAEGESLFNDATALVIFVFIGLHALDGKEITTIYLVQTTSVVLLGSLLIGTIIGFMGLIIMKTTENRTAEMLVLILSGYMAFELSEHFHILMNTLNIESHIRFSGILACIVAIITVHHVMNKATVEASELIHQEEDELYIKAVNRDVSSGVIHSLLKKIQATVVERHRHLRTKEDVQLLAIVANTILFVAMAEMIDLSLLLKYKIEILVMFLATSVIRGLMISVFAWITNQTKRMPNVNFRWCSVLTFAGIKGGLSIVMLTMIPRSFEHLEMFKAVVIGVILLSTFIYSAILIIVIETNKKKFLLEKKLDHAK